MADIPCIYDMSLLSEKDKLNEDIVKGKVFDILLILLSGPRTMKEIAKELNIPSFSAQLYVKRLLDANLIKITETRVVDGKVEKTFELASTDVQILNYLKNSCDQTDGRQNIEFSAQHFASLTREVIRNIGEYKERPHKIKAYFIKSDEESMRGFKKDLEDLFEKYQQLEKSDASETYGLISVFAPYKIE
jgi:predicted transcriptional regulator